MSTEITARISRSRKRYADQTARPPTASRTCAEMTGTGSRVLVAVVLDQPDRQQVQAETAGRQP
jgi:hypothetical protein